MHFFIHDTGSLVKSSFSKINVRIIQPNSCAQQNYPSYILILSIPLRASLTTLFFPMHFSFSQDKLVHFHSRKRESLRKMKLLNPSGFEISVGFRWVLLIFLVHTTVWNLGQKVSFENFEFQTTHKKFRGNCIKD